MGTIKDLPSGKKFTASAWQKKLKQSTNYGDLNSLRDNQEAINAIAKKRQGAIRSGSYDSSRRRSDYQAILKTDDTLDSAKEKGLVRDILDHWGTEPGDSVSKGSTPKTDTKKTPAKPVRRRLEPVQDNYSPFNRDAQAKNTPYGSVLGNSNAKGNYFYNSPPSSGAVKPASSYKPPKLLR